MKIKMTPVAVNTLQTLKGMTNDPHSLSKIYHMDGERLVLLVSKTLYKLGLYPPDMTLTELAAELEGQYPYVAIFLRTAIKRLRKLVDSNY